MTESPAHPPDPLAFVQRSGINANAYMIPLPAAVVIVDPGADEDRAGQLIKKAGEYLRQNPRPVLVLLTHCHYDHCHGLVLLKEKAAFPFYLACHFLGAEKLAGGKTFSEMMGSDFEPVSTDIRLFDTPGGRIDLSDTFSLTLGYQGGGSGPAEAECASMTLADGSLIRLLPTPGHTPDSISIHWTSFLFVGDLFFASNPGIAGLKGWDRDSLRDSLKSVGTLMETADIRTCYSGHGPSIRVKAAIRTARVQLEKTEKLLNLPEMNRERSEFLSGYILDNLSEASKLFTIILGRLYKVSELLDTLDEADKMKEILHELFELEIISDLLDKLGRIFELKKNADQAGLAMIVAAASAFGRIRNLFKEDIYEDFINTAFLHRASRLLGHVIDTIQGIELQVDSRPVSLCTLVPEILFSLNAPPYKESEIMDVTDDEILYLAALIKRISHHPLYDDIDIRFNARITPALVELDKDHFRDIFSTLFESLSLGRPREIRVELESIEEKVAILIRAVPPPPSLCLGDAKKAVVNYGLARYGGAMTEAGPGSIRMELPVLTG